MNKIVKSYTAGGAIPNRRFVKWGSADGQVVLATAATDAVIGVSDHPGGAASGERVDIVRLGFTEIELGGTVTRGGFITTNASGQAVAAAPAAGAVNSVVGRMDVSGVSGDVVPHLFIPGQITGV